MNPFKQLLFAILFLVTITITIFFYQQILARYLDVFFGNWGGLYEFTLLSIPLLIASLMFCLFITFTQDIKYALILAVNAAATPFAFLEPRLAAVLAIGLVISLTLSYLNLQTNLKSYIHFQPKVLIISPLKMLNTLLLITLSLGFYLNANSIIQKEGFKVPDSLIDWAVNISLASSGMNFKGDKQYLVQALTPEQIELLKQNPQILEQYGVKPEDLDALSAPATKQQTEQPTSTVQQGTITATPLPPGNLKNVLKNQINNMLDQTLKPYIFVIPILLAFMFYSLASLILWLLSFFLSPIISLIFYLLEKAEFIKFEKEMREVKKIVI